MKTIKLSKAQEELLREILFEEIRRVESKTMEYKSQILYSLRALEKQVQ
jgi:hypothetical protein